jgi:hypothetical protein
MDDVLISLIPIAFFAAIAVPVCLSIYFGHRARVETQQTVRIAIEHGEPLSTQLLEALGAPSATPEADRRRGVIAIAIGLGVTVFGIGIGYEIYFGLTIVGLGAVPLFVGLAYLGLSKFSRYDRGPNSGDTSTP